MEGADPVLRRRRKEEAAKLRTWLQPHIDLINRAQAVLLWLGAPGQARFMGLCVVVHVLLGGVAELVEGMSMQAMLAYGAGLYFLFQFLLTSGVVSWRSLLMMGPPTGATETRPYTLDDITNAIVSCQFFLLSVRSELERLRNIDQAKCAVQMLVLCFLGGIFLNLISTFTFIYITVFALLLAPGIYHYNVLGKAWRAIYNSHPRVRSVLDTIRQKYSQPSRPASASLSSTSSTTPSSSLVSPRSAPDSSTPSAPSAPATDPDTADFVRISSDKKRD